jgi:hypothetical protein
MWQFYADVRAMDVGHWPADGTALVTKVGRTLDKPKSTVDIKFILRASDEFFRVWPNQPLFDKYVSALAKPRCLKCSGVGSHDATKMNSALGGTSTAAGGADKTAALTHTHAHTRRTSAVLFCFLAKKARTKQDKFGRLW